MRLRTRFFIAAMLPVVVAIAILDLALWAEADREVSKSARDTLEGILVAASEGLYAASPEHVVRFVQGLGNTSIRATLIANDGSVVADSDVQDVSHLPNHRDRPEVSEAFAQGRGESVRYSSTISAPLMYIARRVDLKDGPVVLRLAIPIRDLTQDNHRRHLILGATLVAALAIAALGVWIASAFFFARVKRLSAASFALAKGTSDVDLSVESNDELSILGTALTTLARANKEALERLAAEGSLIRAIIEAMREGVLGIGTDGKITLVNKALLDLTGFRGEPRLPSDLFRSADILKAIRDALDGKEVTIEVEIHHPRHAVLLVRTAPLHNGGAVVVIHDATEIYRLHQVRRDFVANVSHELRNPIATILAAAETLAMPNCNDEERGKLLETISRHAERMGNLVRDLLELSRVESGQYPLNIENVSLAAVIDTAISSFADRARKKHISMTSRIEPADLVCRCDRTALATVLGNLLDNAIKYARPGDKVDVEARQDGTTVLIEVTDTGPGIPEAHLPRIFERFYRVDTGRSRELGGTGLGLAIVKHLVMAMSGTVTVRSIPNQGCTFSVVLPASADA